MYDIYMLLNFKQAIDLVSGNLSNTLGSSTCMAVLVIFLWLFSRIKRFVFENQIVMTVPQKLRTEHLEYKVQKYMAKLKVIYAGIRVCCPSPAGHA